MHSPDDARPLRVPPGSLRILGSISLPPASMIRPVVLTKKHPFSEGNVRAFVQSFSRLPRPERALDGKPNHWYFTIDAIPPSPSDDFIFVVHPSPGTSALKAGLG